MLPKYYSPKFPITKQKLAKLAGVHRNIVGKWAIWAEPFLLTNTQYNRKKQRSLSKGQVEIILSTARSKYIMRCIEYSEERQMLEKYIPEKDVLIVKWKVKYKDKRPFNNKLLFPDIEKVIEFLTELNH